MLLHLCLLHLRNITGIPWSSRRCSSVHIGCLHEQGGFGLGSVLLRGHTMRRELVCGRLSRAEMIR